MRLRCGLVAGLAGWTSALNFNHGHFGPNSKIWIYDNDLFSSQPSIAVSLWERNDGPSLTNGIMIDCEMKHQDTFENSNEYLPLTQPGYNYLECSPDCDEFNCMFENWSEYCLSIYINGEAVDSYDTCIQFQADLAPLGRYEDQFDHDLRQAKTGPRVRRGAKSRTGPSIEGITPRTGSPLGKTLVTIYGTNLHSKKINLAGEESESESEGEDYVIWFERDDWTVPCKVDRMLTLHAAPINGKDFIICETTQAPKYWRHFLRMTIDGGDVLMGGYYDFYDSAAPTANYFYPAASAPAIATKQYDYDGEFFTRWFDIDDNSDGVEDESFIKHWEADRNAFQNCQNPIGIEVYNLDELKLFVNSASENADGRPQADYMDTIQGFKCQNAVQTVNPTTGTVTITCPNTKVRYRCVPSVVQIRGRIYTDVHGRSDDPDFHANRLHESPKVVNDNDGFKSEAVIHLNDGQDCGDHPNCGKNQRLLFKKVSGNDGLINFKVKANVPGAYNFTYETHHQGRAVVNKRYNNYLTNDDMYPVNFEVYPEIKSITPNVGSLNGNTIVTIAGTGFLSDGLGGTVSVTVGDVECAILEMTETMIKCKTAGGDEEPESWAKQREALFIQTPTMSTSHWHKARHLLDEISTLQSCIEACAADHTCLAYIFQDQDVNGHNGCWIIDYMGQSADDETAHRESVWYSGWAGAMSGYIPWANRVDETDCFTGRGETYVGNLAVTKRGHACKAGTFCRNPNPGSQFVPYCEQERDGSWVACEVRGCSEGPSKYSGNRGIQTGMTKKVTYDIHDYSRVTSSYFHNPKLNWIHPSFHISGGKDGMFHEQNDLGNYILSTKNYFIAPFDGLFSFSITGDDRMALRTDYNAENGHYLRDTEQHHSKGVDATQGRSNECAGKIRSLVKGEKVYMESIMTQWGRQARMMVSVVYHGKDQSTGTWWDDVVKEDTPQDNYAYDVQRIYFDVDGREDRTWVTLRVDNDALEAGTGLNEGENFDKTLGLQFRIQQCGDEGRCFTTSNLDTNTWDDDTIEEEIENQWLTTECETSGLMNPLIYHGTYESDHNSVWPGQHHFKKSRHGWCGREAHEVHNHDIWNVHVTPKELRTSETDDICFALLGHAQYLQVYGTFKKADGNPHRAWLKVPLGLNSQTWEWHCIKISEELDQGSWATGDGAYKEPNSEYYDIKYIRIPNDENSEVYIDELHIGNMRQTLEVTQTKKALSFGGQVPTGVDVHVDKSSSWGARFRFRWQSWTSGSLCGWKSELPSVVAIDDDSYTTSITGETTGDDWDGVYVELYDGFINQYLNRDTVKYAAGVPMDYRRQTLDITRSDNSRTIADVFALRSAVVNDEMDVDVKLTLENTPGELNFNMNRNVYPKHLQDMMKEVWPFLGNGQTDGLNIQAWRHGWCGDGYTWEIRTKQHGKMPNINVEFTPKSAHFRPQFYTKRDYLTGVITQIMPGSVTATAHDVPQVVVTANGQRSACVTNCDFEYKADHTPTLDDVAAGATTLARGDSITVTFDVKNYSGTLSNANILVSGAASNCDTAGVTGESSVKTMTCTVGDVAVSDNHSVQLVIPEMGTADYTGGTVFTSSRAVSSHQPTVGSQHGGTIVTVSGTGFATGDVVTVTIGNSQTQCDSSGYDVTYDTLICSTLANADIDAGVTPTLDSVVASGFTANGGMSVVISGSGFDADGDCSDNGYVMVNGIKATALSWSSTEITAESAAFTNSVDVFVYVCNKGNTNTESVTIDLSITSVSQTFSSMEGGAELVIMGTGFDSHASAESFAVSVGDIPCDVSHASASSITCSTGPYTANNVDLTLTARGVFNKYTGADSRDLTIERGQVVNWDWSIGISGVTPQVQLQETANFGEVSGTTMWSELVKGQTGSFKKRFDTVGDFHYSTGLIDSATTFTSATIRVVEAVDKPLRVNVLINGVEANHVGSSDNTQPGANTCVFIGTPQTVANEAAGHFVTYSNGATPVLDSFELLDSAHSDHPNTFSPMSRLRVTLNGSPAPSCAAGVKVSVGTADCVVSDNTQTYFECDIMGVGLDVTAQQGVSVSVPGMGKAYFDNQAFVAATEDPPVDGFYTYTSDMVTLGVIGISSTPAKISRIGGAALVISGAGFVNPTVYVQEESGGAKFYCEIMSFTYETINCNLAAISSLASGFDMALVMSVIVNDVTYTMDVSLEILDSFTPKITSISPTTVMSSGTVVTFSGSALDGLSVSIGGEPCIEVESTSSEFQCTMADTPSGLYSVNAVGSFGSVQSNIPLNIEVKLDASSINPVQGNTNGGSLITISGFGFDHNTVVTVRDNDGHVLCLFCYKTSVAPSEIVFSSPRSPSSGVVKVTVSHEFISTAIDAFDFTYMESSSSVTTSPSDTSALVGGDSVELNGSFDCASSTVEVVRSRDPCEAGQHNCHHRASCTPTADGLDYTCACDATTDTGLAYGDGFECFWFNRWGDVKTWDQLTDNFCRETGNILDALDINSVAMEEYFKEYLEKMEGTHARGTYVKWYGQWTCVRNQHDADGNVAFEIMGTDKATCEDTGSATKRVHCLRPSNSHISLDETMKLGAGNGLREYVGNKDTTFAGHKCAKWSETQWADDHEFMVVNRENYCTTVWSSNWGPLCAMKDIRGRNDEYVVSPCGIPTAEELASRSSSKKRSSCVIKTLAETMNEYVSDASDTWNAFNGDCFFGGDHDQHILNPRRCLDVNRAGKTVNLIPVNGKPGTFYIERRHVGSYTKKFLVATEADESKNTRVTWDAKEENELGSKHEWAFVENAFGPGTVAIRNGINYMRAPPTNISGGSYINLIHQYSTPGIEESELAWSVHCVSDDYSDIINQRASQVEVLTTITPTCTASSVSFTMPDLPAGSYKVRVRDDTGIASGAVDVTYSLDFDSVSPNTVGTGGGVELTLLGTGFTENTKAMICGEELPYVRGSAADGPGDAEEIVFVTLPIDLETCPSPQLTLSDIDSATDGMIETADNGRKRRSGSFTVDGSLTPTVTSVDPVRGGTAGGTQLTIAGTHFGTDLGNVQVTIAGSLCAVSSVSDTQIICQTGQFDRSQAQVAVAPLVNILGGAGNAVVDESVTFWYIDRWSSPYTWGCADASCKPKDGEIIVIPQGHVILLDETTPHLKVLIIDGGKMIWDRAADIELHMDYGVVNNGGHFEIGTEDDPFCSGDATIKMYGNQRSINLPIYGAKVFAVRFGTISIYGCPKTTTWTELDVTAEAGATQIVLTHPVHDDWFADNEIIIAATGDITNFHRSEKRTIASVSADGYTVTLTEPLEHRHIAVCNNGPGNNGLGFGWAGEICMRAEVGLLTRNIKFTGDKNHLSQLDDCELGAGLAMGVQTCFQNRYGHETGSDQFGGILFLHKPDYAHIAFAEFTHVGQAFNLARYPIHFHTPGSLPGSFVRGNAIHNTFNRALTMHGVHNLTVEYNVVYNVMGLAFFLEDAVEEDNLLRYNLGIMNKKSSSLLNVDSTPAVFWIPNPNNIFHGNRAAGSTHFGFWFNPPDEPTGPSAKDPQYDNFCVKNRPLGAFFNNTAHSMGQYGMWVFTDLTPTSNGACGDSQNKAIRFGEIPEVYPGTTDAIAQQDRDSMFGFFAWHCLRGAEVATGGAMHFTNFIAANNWVSGLAWKETFLDVFALDALEDEGSMYKRSIVIGHMDGDQELTACGDMGIETPWKRFSFTVDDIAFYNYDEPTPDQASVELSALPTAGELPERRCVAVDPCYGSNAFDCGAITFYKNVKWDNCARRTTFAWEHEAALYDIDGSFAGQGAGKFIVSQSDAFNPNLCQKDTSGKYDLDGEAPHPAQICHAEKNGETFKLHRFMFNQASPQSMEGTMAVFENEWGITKTPFRNCRPRGEGWMVLLEGEQEYKMYFEQHQHISNISYQGDIDDFEQGDWLTLRHDLPERVDHASVSNKAMANKDEVNFEIEGTWPSDPSQLATYSYNVDSDKAPFSMRYTFNGRDNEENPQLDAVTKGSLTYGQSYFVRPNFYKCFFKDCIVPEPAPPTPAPEMSKCNYMDCVNATTIDHNDLSVSIGQHMVIDSVAVAAVGKHFKFGSIFLEGTLEVEASSLSPGEELIIEADHLIMNTGAFTASNINSRKRRDTVHISNGGLIIGTADNPIPCGVKVTLLINGDIHSQSFGAFPDSVPIGAKAIGGLGNVIMHGCQRKWWTQLDTDMSAGDNQILVNEDVNDWVVGDEIAIAASGYDHRHTEYFSITNVNGRTLLLNATAQHPHLGASTTSQGTLLGREFNQGAEVALLTRNIVLDGTGGSDGSFGARVVITSWTEEHEGHHYVRSGAGQFSGVEFKGFGQAGYDKYDDMRAQILFYNVDAALDMDTGRAQSYVRDCSFHNGYHTAVAALFDSNNLEISNNVIFKTIGSAIKVDGTGVTIDGNIIGNVFQMQLASDYFASTVNTNFADDEMPAGVDTEMTTDTIVTNNRVTGVDGSCFAGVGVACDASEACDETSVGGDSGNVGHSCLRGYYILRIGQQCNRVSGYNFYKISHFGVLFYTEKAVNHNIIDNVVIADSRVSVASVMTGPDSIMHLATEKSVTVKNSVIIGKSSAFDCTYDGAMVNTFTTNEHLGRQKPPLRADESAAFLFPDFVHKGTGFPACALLDLDMDVAIYGRTCVFNTAISEYNGKCGGKDYVVSTNARNFDHTFSMDFVSGNSATNCETDTLVRFHRPDTGTVNTADCVDLHCDGLKNGFVRDSEGGIFGGDGGTYMAESEYEWDGVTRATLDGQVTYEDPRDGLGDYRIPVPMQTRLDGSQIPLSEVYTNAGVVRDDSCDYRPAGPGWFCPTSSGLEYHDLIYEMMDEDHLNRRLTPLAVRSEGYLTIYNGPGDHTCCIGYACSQRLMTIHTTVACGKEYDYYFTSTLPVEAKFHLPYAGEDCKVKVALYTKRPNRVDVQKDGVFMPATNADVAVDGTITWNKPDDSFIPSVASSASGANYQQRSEQLIHLVMSGGHTYTLKTVQTLVLELSVGTSELTEDDFYDNGNLANNIAALLGVNPDRIRVMNVISETASTRRRRHAKEGWIVHGRSRRSEEGGFALQIEVMPEQDTNTGADQLDDIAIEAIENPAALASAVVESVQELDPNVVVEETVAVGAPPKAPEEQPEPVTLAEQLGVAEITPEDNLDDFIASLNEAAGMDITTLETAQERQEQEQEEADKAAELIVYSTPTTMVLDANSMPSTAQVLGVAMFDAIRLSVVDQDGTHMETVGYVADPYTVKAELFNTVMTDGGSVTPSLDGDTVMEFVAGSGYATFSNLVIRGDVKTTQIKFSIKNPSDSPIAAVISNAIEFLPFNGQCVVQEGGVFDRKIGMSETCDFVCMAPCASALAPQCNSVSRCEGVEGDATFATCNAGGCECDLDSMPAKNEINPADYMSATCSPNSIELRMNKCMVNKFGFTLNDLYINGPTKTESFDDLETSTTNTCRGMLAFDNGPEYVFKIDRTLSDCRTQKGVLNGQATFVNAVQGSAGFDVGQITRKRDILINFGCKFDVDLTLSTNIGSVSSQHYDVTLETGEGNFDLSMAVYEDNSFTKVAENGVAVSVPDHVHIGVVGKNIGDMVVVAQDCWITPDNDPTNLVRYNVLANSCANTDDADNINVVENGVNKQSRFSFASFEFSGDDSGQLYAHCDVRLCDPNNETCQPTCSGRRRRNDENEMVTQFSFAINVAGSEGSTKKDCSSQPCVDV